MKKLNYILLIVCLFIGQNIMAKNNSINKSNSTEENNLKEVFIVRIFKTTSKQQLEHYKNKASEAGITIEYPTIQIVNGEIESLGMQVDCNDGYSGNFTTVDIPESGVGFIRDYSEDAEEPFKIGYVFAAEKINNSDKTEFNTPFNKESKIKRDEEEDEGSKIRHDHEIEFMIGLNNYLTPDGQLPDNDNADYSIDPITSWTYAINSVHKVSFSKHFKTDFHIGVQWYNFALANPDYQILKGPEEVLFFDRSFDNPTRSKLNITYLNAGILPMIYLGDSQNSFRIGAGIYGGYRLGSKSKFKYDDDGKDVLKKNFHLNSLQYGVKARVGWKGVDLFATYDLNSLFIKDRGPELNAFSFGIVF